MDDGSIAKRHAGGNEYSCRPGRWADEIEQRIIRAYFQLVRATGHSDRPQTVMVARLGSLEVRLTRASGEDVRSDAPPFRLEVFSPASSTAMESLGCFNFDDGELAAAARFVLRAGHDTTAHPQLGASPCVC
jgi:hypothetical protein